MYGNHLPNLDDQVGKVAVTPPPPPPSWFNVERVLQRARAPQFIYIRRHRRRYLVKKYN